MRFVLHLNTLSQLQYFAKMSDDWCFLFDFSLTAYTDLWGDLIYHACIHIQQDL